MSDDFEFSIRESTLAKMLSLKKDAGFENKGWDEWFDHIFGNSITKSTQDEIEKTMEKLHYESFDDWVQNFAVNLNNIWNESSTRDLDPTTDPNYKKEEHSAIVIGRGPSIKKHKHLELIANSDYKGSIICCDGALISALSAGVTPEKFPQFYVVTIDSRNEIKEYYNDELVDKYGSKIKGIFSTVVQPPTIQTGGNVGTSSWFVSWQILKCSTVALVGINHGWNEDDPWEQIMTHGYT